MKTLSHYQGQFGEFHRPLNIFWAMWNVEYTGIHPLSVFLAVRDGAARPDLGHPSEPIIFVLYTCCLIYTVLQNSFRTRVGA